LVLAAPHSKALGYFVSFVLYFNPENHLVLVRTDMKAPGPGFFDFSMGLRGNIPAFFLALHRKYGDVVRCPVPLSSPLYILNHPEHIRHVLSLNASNYPREDFISRRFQAVFGNGSVSATGDAWARQRKIINPAFQRKFLERSFHVLEKRSRELVASWKTKAQNKEPVEVVSEMRNLTMDMLWEVLFNFSPKHLRQEIYRPVELGVSYIGTPVPLFISKWLPTPTNWQFYFENRKLERILKERIARRRKHIGATDDLLDFLLRYEDPKSGLLLSGQAILEELKTLAPAGYLTTGASLAWLFYLLGKHPEHIGKLNEECKSVKDAAFSYAHFESLPYTLGCIYETLRLYPTGWSLWRCAREEDVIDGFRIEKGATMVSSPYTAHRHPEFWSAPETFDPRRDFSSSMGHTYFPFGLGPRRCVGENLAMVELMMIVPMLFRHFRFSVLPGPEVRMDHRVILSPVPSLNIQLEAIGS
jgi:cytochrome P450